MALQEKLSIIGAIRYSMNDPKFRFAPDDIVSRLTESNRLNESSILPRILPSEKGDKQWYSLVEAYNLRWLQEMANVHMAGDTKELAVALFEAHVAVPLREEMIKQEIVERLLRDQSLLKEIQAQNGETDPVKLRKQILSRWDAFPKEIYATLSAEVSELIEPLWQAQRTSTLTKFTAIIDEFVKQNGGHERFSEPVSDVAVRLTELPAAYLEDDAARFNTIVEAHLSEVSENNLARPERVGIGTELFYNRFSPFYLASILYLISVFSTVFSWIGYHKQFSRVAFSLNGLALAVQIAGIVMRIVISGRPPVTTLYSTFLFVSAMGVMILMVVERLSKLGLGTLIAALSTFTALLWAWTISIADGDTFTVLVAVLDTQFWLSTHVLCISTGYAATMVAGLLGVGYIVGGVLLPIISEENKRQLSVNIYGITCFALLCSFFGTVLGGLWADDSWGRFWGWDPKENGALMIVLWNAVLLHARWAGMAKQRGIAVLAVLGCVVTIWSWEGVNQLGEGLHSYGFSSDRLFYVAVFAAIHLVIAAAGCIPRGPAKESIAR
jgi:ABC-type transport system involved in cytochrome c biogenesis permease subunit